jgi:hypothetical protein
MLIKARQGLSKLVNVMLGYDRLGHLMPVLSRLCQVRQCYLSLGQVSPG